MVLIDASSKNHVGVTYSPRGARFLNSEPRESDCYTECSSLLLRLFPEVLRFRVIFCRCRKLGPDYERELSKLSPDSDLS